ncbi:hypothetical protein [Paenibacillus larvae]|uniref:hypothetical protein n=1 Tax=Paenibacillus larvae TaxID=1464 RepID=UPI0028923979|nr:hypothetical protein [Paenibacillus larvae]MDT2310333.1 hypothetical protein [Paenibacillus larvae]
MADPKQPNSSNMSRLGKHAKRARRASRLKRTLTFLFTCFILASLCAGALLFLFESERFASNQGIPDFRDV